MPDVTVIVPVYNRATIVERTLDSIDAQRQPGEKLTLIVVDNNSTDDTLNVVERWASDHRSATFDIIVTTEAQPGATAARNKGLSMARSEVIMFFDSDDLMPDKLTYTVAQAFGERPEIDIFVWPVRYNRMDGRSYTKHTWNPKTPFFNAIVHGMLATQRYAIKRSVLLRAGGWDEGVKVWNDMELSVRLLLLDPMIEPLHLAELPVLYETPVSITTSISHRGGGDTRCEYSLACCERSLVESGREDVARWVDFRRVLLAADYARQGSCDDARRLLGQVHRLPWLFKKLIYYKHRLYRRGSHYLMPYRRV